MLYSCIEDLFNVVDIIFYYQFELIVVRRVTAGRLVQNIQKMFVKKVFLELRKQLCLRSVFLKLFTNYCPTEHTLDKYPYQSPSFQVWKLCGNAALQHSFGWITPNSAEFSQKEIRLNFSILCKAPTYSFLVMH